MLAATQTPQSTDRRDSICWNTALGGGASAPQPVGGDRGALGERGELGPDDRRHDRVGLPGEGGETAISASYDTLAPDDLGVMANVLRDQPRVLDKIGRRVDAARHQDPIVGDFG